MKVGDQVKVRYQHPQLGPRMARGLVIGIRRINEQSQWVILNSARTVDVVAPEEILKVEVINRETD